SSRRRHTRSKRDWSSDVCSSDLALFGIGLLVWFLLSRRERLDYLVAHSNNRLRVSTTDLFGEIIAQEIQFIIIDSGITLFSLVEIGRASSRERALKLISAA